MYYKIIFFEVTFWNLRGIFKFNRVRCLINNDATVNLRNIASAVWTNLPSGWSCNTRFDLVSGNFPLGRPRLGLTGYVKTDNSDNHYHPSRHLRKALAGSKVGSLSASSTNPPEERLEYLTVAVLFWGSDMVHWNGRMKNGSHNDWAGGVRRNTCRTRAKCHSWRTFVSASLLYKKYPKYVKFRASNDKENVFFLKLTNCSFVVLAVNCLYDTRKLINANNGRYTGVKLLP